jgi:hypothetical protein
MSGTNNEFQMNQDEGVLIVSQQRPPLSQARHLNLNPLSASRGCSKVTSGERRELIISSFSATTFAVKWEFTKEPSGTAKKSKPSVKIARSRLIQLIE